MAGQQPNLAVAVLAAGSREYDADQRAEQVHGAAWMLQPLGDRAMINYVMDLAHTVAPAEQIIVVTDQAGGALVDHLGPTYTYVVQETSRGTGDAVWQVRDQLGDYAGPVLILYGDTPLIRDSSVRGLLTRHQLKGAAMTLLCAFGDASLPYGRVRRAADGRIVDVVEARDDTDDGSTLHELNIGAYVAQTPALWDALAAVAGTPDTAHRLTDCVRLLAADRARVEGYQALDPDEIFGINTPDDLERATVILQKRQLRPRRNQERNLIRFGTGGWRALIGEGFTLDNVRRLCQALADDIIRGEREQDAVLIGYDRRFLGREAAETAAEVFAGNNIPVQLLREAAPTPLVTYATARHTFAYGLMFTASHNPAQWNGLKVFASDGSLPLDDQTRVIADRANALSPGEVSKVELDIALDNGMVQMVDYTNAYVDAVEALIDLDAIRDAGLRVAVDPMYGVGQVTLEIVLTEARCRLTTIHTRHDPLFGGRSPAPDRAELSQLISIVREGEYDLGLAMDGDADRIAIVDDRGAFISTNELLLLLYYYLHEIRGLPGGVTRNLATTHLLDRLAAHFGEQCHEVPVGFKHLADSMKRHNVLLAGESSGGLSIRGHILGKDGIFACALVVEMIAVTGLRVSALLDKVYALTGKLVSREVNLPATSEMKVMVPRKLAHADLRTIAGIPVVRISHEDGTKFYLANDNWLLLRFSGTEPLLRIFAEADDEATVDALIAWADELVHS